MKTEFGFTLPKGYVDENGTIHRDGVMRLATAGDEILPMKDSRIQANPSYLGILLLARVITRLGNLPMITTRDIERLFNVDFVYLEEFYKHINTNENTHLQVDCPHCGKPVEVEFGTPVKL